MNYKQAYEQAQKSGEARSLTPTYKENWQKGEILVGRYLGRQELTSKLNQQPYYIYTIETDEGPVRTILGSGVDHAEGGLMRVGEIYALKYEGMERLKGGQNMHRFRVDWIPVPEGQIAAAGDEIPI